MSPRDLILALLVVIVWGLSFIAIRWGVDEVAPLLMTALGAARTVLEDA